VETTVFLETAWETTFTRRGAGGRAQIVHKSLPCRLAVVNTETVMGTATGVVISLMPTCLLKMGDILI